MVSPHWRFHWYSEMRLTDFPLCGQVTQLSPGPRKATGPEHKLTSTQQRHSTGLSYAYGAALPAALLLASRLRRLWWKLSAGLLALVPFQE